MSKTRDRIAQEAAIDEQIRAEVEGQEGGNMQKIFTEKIYEDYVQQLNNTVRQEKLLDGSTLSLLKVERIEKISEFKTATVHELYVEHAGKSFKVDRANAESVFTEVALALNGTITARLIAKYQDFVTGGSNVN